MRYCKAEQTFKRMHLGSNIFITKGNLVVYSEKLNVNNGLTGAYLKVTPPPRNTWSQRINPCRGTAYELNQHFMNLERSGGSKNDSSGDIVQCCEDRFLQTTDR